MSLAQKLNIRLKALSLLLVYLFSSSPAILFHHHGLSLIPFERASSCEKAIYYSAAGNACKHGTHITIALEKCSLCDNHVVSAHSAQPFIAAGPSNITSICRSAYAQNYVPAAVSSFFNKGPPQVSASAI